MKKILIVGDSHVASLKQAEHQVLGDYEAELYFLAASGPSQQCVSFNESCITIKPRPVWKVPDNAFYSIEQFDRQYDNLVNQFKKICIDKKVRYDDYSEIVFVGGGILSGDWRKFILDVGSFSTDFLNDLFMEHLKNNRRTTWAHDMSKVALENDVYVLLSPLINEMAYEVQKNEVDRTIPNKINRSYLDTYDFVTHGFKSISVNYSPLPFELFSNDLNSMSRKFKTKAPQDMAHLNKNGGKVRLKALLDLIFSKKT
ncbi:MAG: hypothetical protein ACQEW0_01930 [Pseudomonadota bacterium]